ncbi:MAG: carbon storage regulator [Bacillota bacterium]|nr:carbon storage regulator [Bacillota bacterium]
MLVITRKESESIIIGDGIEIIVSEIGTDRVKICINAPKDVPIMRKELLETCDLNIEAGRGVSKQALNRLKSML